MSKGPRLIGEEKHAIAPTSRAVSMASVHLLLYFQDIYYHVLMGIANSQAAWKSPTRLPYHWETARA